MSVGKRFLVGCAALALGLMVALSAHAADSTDKADKKADGAQAQGKKEEVKKAEDAKAPAKPSEEKGEKKADKPADEKKADEKKAQAKKPAAEKPAAKKDEAKKEEAKKPADKQTDAKKADAKKSADKKADRKPADKKPAGKQPVSFAKDIAPILLEKCVACHGATQPQGGYQLHTFAALMTPGDSTLNPVTAKDVDDSELLRLVSETDKDSWMPKEGERLPQAQIDLIRRWVEEGAKYDAEDPKATLSSIVPRKYAPAPEAYPATLPVTALAFSADGKELAAAGYNEITVWNPADGQLLRRMSGVAQRTYGLQYSPDGELLAVASGTPGQLGEVVLLDAATGKLVKFLAAINDVAFDVAFNPEGTKLAAAAADRSIRVFDVATGAQELLIEDHADWVLGVAFSPDGKLIASASRDKTSKVFKVENGESQATYNGHGNTVYSVAFSPDGKQVLTAGHDRKVQVWNPADGKKIAEITGFGGEVHEVAVVDGDVYACSADKSARQFKAADRKSVRTYGGHADFVYALAVHPESKLLATGAFNGEIRIWNTEDGKQLRSFFAAPGYKPGK